MVNNMAQDGLEILGMDLMDILPPQVRTLDLTATTEPLRLTEMALTIEIQDMKETLIQEMLTAV